MSDSTGSGSSTGSGGSGGGTPPVIPPTPPPVVIDPTRPRIWLTSTLLTTLRAKAASNDPMWVVLKTKCDSYLAGHVEWPDGNDYPSNGSIGEGYQGSDYFDPILNLGLAYQVIKVSDPATAALYAAKGADILTKMSAITGIHAVNPLRDSGYGIRFFGVGMAIGFDWFYETLGSDVKASVCAALNMWIDAFTNGGFGRQHPQGNYFAGYYAAVGLAAIATDGDNTKAPTYWQDWLTKMHGTMVQPYYSKYMVGGGWPEGWNYGTLGTLNMCWPILAAKTAKGLDLIGGATPFTFPVDQGLYVIHFTWPNKITIDDRGALYSSDNPSAARPHFVTCLAGLQSLLGSPNAAVFHKFARDARSLQSDKVGEWQNFLFWDETAVEKDVSTLPKSYFAKGMGMVAVRSSWAADAVWGSFTSAPYVGYGGSGEEYFDQGSLAIVRGNTPFLVNSTGTLIRSMDGVNDGDKWWNFIYDENYGNNNLDPTKGNRTIYNIFYVKASSYGQAAYGPPDFQPKTRIARFEDRSKYVLIRGALLADMYRKDPDTGKPSIVAWTRDIVYVRPDIFVVYDRTTIADATKDHWMAWHLIKTPTEVPSAPGNHRFDVVKGTNFIGAVTTLLPVGHNPTLENLYGSNKVYKLSVRAGTPNVEERWLSVFDASTDQSKVALATRMSLLEGNVKSGAVQGTLLERDTQNYVVLFSVGGPDPQLSGTVRYEVPMKQTYHILTNMILSTDYTVTVTPVNGKYSIKIVVGPGIKSSANGVLSFSTDSSGNIS